MSRIFRITGKQYSAFFKKSFKFEGEILVTGNILIGYCEDIYENNPKKYPRFLSGVVADEEEIFYGLGFYKLTNDPDYIPNMVLLSNINDPYCGSWSEMNDFHMFQFQGKATIMIEQLPFSSTGAFEIEKKFEELDRSIGANQKLLHYTDYCKKSLLSEAF